MRWPVGTAPNWNQPFPGLYWATCLCPYGLQVDYYTNTERHTHSRFPFLTHTTHPRTHTHTHVQTHICGSCIMLILAACPELMMVWGDKRLQIAARDNIWLYTRWGPETLPMGTDWALRQELCIGVRDSGGDLTVSLLSCVSCDWHITKKTHTFSMVWVTHSDSSLTPSSLSRPPVAEGRPA